MFLAGLQKIPFGYFYLMVRVEGERNSGELLDSGRRLANNNARIFIWLGSCFVRPLRVLPPLLIEQQKIPFGYFYLMVRVEGVGPSSLAWEANIIAVIRYPQ